MNKKLLDLQKGVKGAAAIVCDEEYITLRNSVAFYANIESEKLFNAKLGNPFFKKQLEDKSKLEDIVYLVIGNIDAISKELQNRFVGLVKDREFMGYNLPKNCVIVFTVSNALNLKNISSELYHFCVLV